MSDQDQKMREEDLVVAEDTQLDEFKASMGDPSEVPEPVAKTAKAPGKSKKQEDDPQDSPTAVKPTKPAEATAGKGKTAKLPMGESKMSMIQAMVERMNSMKRTDLAGVFEDMLAAAEAKEIIKSMSLKAGFDSFSFAFHATNIYHSIFLGRK